MAIGGMGGGRGQERGRGPSGDGRVPIDPWTSASHCGADEMSAGRGRRGTGLWALRRVSGGTCGSATVSLTHTADRAPPSVPAGTEALAGSGPLAEAHAAFGSGADAGRAGRAGGPHALPINRLRGFALSLRTRPQGAAVASSPGRGWRAPRAGPGRAWRAPRNRLRGGRAAGTGGPGGTTSCSTCSAAWASPWAWATSGGSRTCARATAEVRPRGRGSPQTRGRCGARCEARSPGGRGAPHAAPPVPLRARTRRRRPRDPGRRGAWPGHRHPWAAGPPAGGAGSARRGRLSTASSNSATREPPSLPTAGVALHARRCRREGASTSPRARPCAVSPDGQARLVLYAAPPLGAVLGSVPGRPAFQAPSRDREGP